MFHSDKYDTDGLFVGNSVGCSSTESSICLKDIEDNGGSLDGLREFIMLAKEYAVFAASELEVNEKVFSAFKRKRSGNEVTETEVSKLSRKEKMDNDEREELEDPNGLEKSFQKAYVRAISIPLENINLSGDLKMIPHKHRVQEIITSVKLRYDPSKSVLVVTPVERDMNSLDNPNQKFVVIQKVHLFQAFKELDKEGLFQTLPGHEERQVLCWVVDVCSAALMTYGNIRSNDIDFRFAEKTYPQDLLWVYKTLSAKDRPENALKVVERLSKLARIGPNEDIAIRKLCKWNQQNFNNLMLTIDQLEKYETLDVESSIKTSTSQYGKKLKIKHATFNKLAKIDEDYFSANFEKVVNKKASLKTIVTQFQEVKDIADVYSLLTRISGFQTVEALKLQYPGQFEVDNVKVYVGADFKCKNMKVI